MKAIEHTIYLPVVLFIMLYKVVVVVVVVVMDFI